MTNPKDLLKYFNEIPKEFWSRACIAGGAVLDLKKARDIDIFVLRCPELIELEIIKQFVTNDRQSEWNTTDSSDKKAIVFTGEDGRKINVICDEAETVQELLGGFDISASQWAVDMKGRLHHAPTATEPGQPILIFYISRTTFPRIQKYARRFGLGGMKTDPNPIYPEIPKEEMFSPDDDIPF